MNKGSVQLTSKFHYVILIIGVGLLGLLLLVDPVYAQTDKQTPPAQESGAVNVIPSANVVDDEPITETLTSTLITIDTPGLVIEAPASTPGSSSDNSAATTFRTTLFFPLVTR